ncbi:hypothetical protein B296_00038854, partial [Ensete ventricosum]
GGLWDPEDRPAAVIGDANGDPPKDDTSGPSLGILVKLMAVGTLVRGGGVDMLLADPFSAGGLTPHFPSDSSGSNTCTPPSVRPKANWFGSDGCGAITAGYTVVLSKQVGSNQK